MIYTLYLPKVNRWNRNHFTLFTPLTQGDAHENHWQRFTHREHRVFTCCLISVSPSSYTAIVIHLKCRIDSYLPLFSALRSGALYAHTTRPSLRVLAQAWHGDSLCVRPSDESQMRSCICDTPHLAPAARNTWNVQVPFLCD